MLRYHCDSSNGLPSYIYDELHRVQECSFQFEDESSPSDLVERMAELLAPYKEFPPERLLDGEILLFEFDRDQIKVRFLDSFGKRKSSLFLLILYGAFD
jgi:secreted Zn-dependent insulinase-like peptidase